MNHTTLTLGELLTHSNETIKRNAMSILKTLQKESILLHAQVDGYNAGFDKNKRRVFFCEQARRETIQEQQNSGEWLCLHN